MTGNRDYKFVYARRHGVILKPAAMVEDDDQAFLSLWVLSHLGNPYFMHLTIMSEAGFTKCYRTFGLTPSKLVWIALKPCTTVDGL